MKLEMQNTLVKNLFMFHASCFKFHGKVSPSVWGKHPPQTHKIYFYLGAPWRGCFYLGR
jgi:hypothetical protein